MAATLIRKLTAGGNHTDLLPSHAGPRRIAVAPVEGERPYPAQLAGRRAGLNRDWEMTGVVEDRLNQDESRNAIFSLPKSTLTADWSEKERSDVRLRTVGIP